MELTKKRSPLGGGSLSPRAKTIAAALLAALAAAVLLATFLQKYRSTVDADALPATALVAGSLIEKGTSGEVLAAGEAARPTELTRSDLRPEAVTDPALLKGQVATRDIYPGQQLTAADFAPAAGIATKLAADERAISIPLDGAHGMIGNVSPGDRVDVLGGFLVDTATGRPRPFLRVLVPGALVLEAPPKEQSTGGVSSGSTKLRQVVLRVGQDDAPKLAFAVDNGKVWLLLRGAGADLPKKQLITLESTLFGSRAVAPSASGRSGKGSR
ncbi:MAG TPA: Flp pilus assembly protein CpaB [Solirubrobacteraceae bacterium]|nr:Flp pilus assembly protein CpaB [Solirubrobacteraceae bacterium]